MEVATTGGSESQRHKRRLDGYMEERSISGYYPWGLKGDFMFRGSQSPEYQCMMAVSEEGLRLGALVVGPLELAMGEKE